MRKAFLHVLVLSCTLVSCHVLSNQDGTPARTNTIDARTHIDLSVVRARRESLSFIFELQPYDPANRRFHALQMVVSKDEQIFAKIRPGVGFESVSFLAPGSGMAARDDGGYSDLILDPRASHYIFYESPTTYRAELLAHETDRVLLRATFHGIVVRGQRYTFQEYPGDTLFFALVIDRNLNGVLDPGEYRRYTVLLE